MRSAMFLCGVFAGLFCVLSSPPAGAAVRLGTGNASLLGGDLTDPEDKIIDTGDFASSRTEAEMRPPNATWVSMKCAPISPPGTAPHSIHPYQNWQNHPACAIFLNHPENQVWYVGFKDGGFGGPTAGTPYYAAVQLKEAYKLTHFTLTSGFNMPGRDPKSWAIQGSNSGQVNDWTDIYRCKAGDRSDGALRASPRCETTLYTSFTSATMGQAVSAADAKKLQAKLKGAKIAKADFAPQTKAYTWFRVAVYSCYNLNSMNVPDPAAPPGFQLGQMELYGVSGKKEAPKATAPEEPVTALEEPVTALEEPAKAPAYDVPFIISYWCGPPKAETTLARYKEIAECGFNVAQSPNLWEPADVAQERFVRKFLNICQQAGLKALVWDGHIPQGDGWKAPKPEEIPQIEKALDGMIARYSSHPAFLGFILGDEAVVEGNQRLGLVNQYLLKKDPKHLPYFNLLPNYAHGFVHGPPGGYERMVVDFIENVKPALVSWDHYRQMFEGGDERYYWENLEIIRRLCLKAKIPYNQIIVSFRHMGYRECSEADLRWQVWTSLAYGSRGIQYFTYWYVKGLAWAEAPALITKDGKRDAKYNYVKKINHRIAKLGPTLVKLTSTGVYCTDPLPPGTVKLAADAPVKAAAGGPMAIGCFADAAGTPFILVVNRSFRDKIAARLTMDEKTVSACEISQETGKPLAAKDVASKALVVPLEPGEGRLFRLNQKATASSQ